MSGTPAEQDQEHVQEPAGPLPATAAVASFPWRRLDPRMLLVHPAQEVIKFLPFVVGVFVLGNAGGGRNWWWQLGGVAVPVLLGVVRFLTTRYRVTPTQVELQRGLIGRKVLTARLDRVRAVELTSSPIYRILGLTKVEIGTASGGQDDDKFALDGLPLLQARQLRVALLHRTPYASEEDVDRHDDTSASTPAGAAPPPSRASEDVVLMRLDPGWVRYAPLTSSGNVVAAGLLALLAQAFERSDLGLLGGERVAALFTDSSLALVVLSVVLGFVVLGAAFAVLGYLATNWGFTLSRDVRGRSFHVRRGLLTSTEMSLERDRVRGVEVAEPLGLRLVGAGRLSAVVTGLSRSERSSTLLVPPAPREVVDAVGGQLIDDPLPLHLGLRRHGPAARRRRYARALIVAAVPAVTVLALGVLAGLSWWAVLPALLLLPVAALLAADRYRRLGHGLTEDHLVVRSGSLRGRRDVLQRSGIIGWNVRQSWFQRRAGLVTLVATTAAGRQAYAVVDILEPEAVALARSTSPMLLGEFLLP